MTHLSIIAGSTRPGRFGITPARWLFELAQKELSGKADIEFVDLAEQGLPLLDEAVPPSQGKYEHEHTKRWAATVARADGFFFVTPEYNHSLPGALKNALDFVYAEWNDKPAAFLSYGSLAGGARAVEHLRGICGDLKMYDLREQILLPNYWDNLDAAGHYQFNERHVTSATKILGELAFWAGVMKAARAQRE